jgi:hypothetical protein
MKTRMLAAAAAALMLAPLACGAQSYRCVGQDGKKYYGSTVPRPCIGRPVEELNAHGMVVKRIDPEGSEKERIAKEAKEAKQREEVSAQREVTRRNRALLATYTSLKDIDDARGRALAENQKAVEEIQARIERIKKGQAGYDARNAEADLKYHEQLLAAKQKEVAHINEKYGADRKRYAELTGGR